MADMPDSSSHSHETDTLHRRGVMFILSSPSGAGKTTLSRMLLASDEEIMLSVSATTRAPREGEVDGKDYHFVSNEEFDRLGEEDGFYEWAPEGLKRGQDFLFDIDWQGTQQLYQKDQQDTVSVFILPPSLDELHRRLTARALDSEEVVNSRMERARAEISHWAEYDYVVINDNVDACFTKVREILHAERMKRTRQTGLIPFVRELMG